MVQELVLLVEEFECIAGFGLKTPPARPDRPWFCLRRPRRFGIEDQLAQSAIDFF